MITDELASAYPTVTAGTYSLQGEYIGKILSPYYSSNVAILKSAFGESNCEEDTDVLTCSLSDYGGYYTASVGSSGDVKLDVVEKTGHFYCEIRESSFCHQD